MRGERSRDQGGGTEANAEVEGQGCKRRWRDQVGNTEVEGHRWQVERRRCEDGGERKEVEGERCQRRQRHTEIMETN